MTKNLSSFVAQHLIFIIFTKKLLTCHLPSPLNEAFLCNNTHREIRLDSNTVWLSLLQSCDVHGVSGL